MFSRVKKPAIILLAISLVLGLAAAGFLLFPNRIPNRISELPVQVRVSLGPKPDPTSPTTAPTTGEAPEKKDEGSQPAEGLMYDMGSRVVNLADPGGYRYLKVGIVLEIVPTDQALGSLAGEARQQAEEQILEEIDEQRPIIEDVITLELTSKTFEEVFTVEGKEQLKEEIREDLNTRLNKHQIRDIYFTEFVIQ